MKARSSRNIGTAHGRPRAAVGWAWACTSVPYNLWILIIRAAEEIEVNVCLGVQKTHSRHPQCTAVSDVRPTPTNCPTCACVSLAHLNRANIN